MRTICFDTETTGLPETRSTSIYETNKWPHIVQLSFLVFDDELNAIVDEYDEIIKINDNVELTPRSVEIHGITREISINKGVAICDALLRFKHALNACDTCVAHNISFDKRMLIVEAMRNRGFDTTDTNKYSGIPLKFRNGICTMINAIEICKINRFRKDGTVYYKYPTLSELHNHLFKIIPKNTHNSKIDVLICLRCFYKLSYNKDLSIINRHFRRIFRECL